MSCGIVDWFGWGDVLLMKIKQNITKQKKLAVIKWKAAIQSVEFRNLIASTIIATFLWRECSPFPSVLIEFFPECESLLVASGQKL